MLNAKRKHLAPLKICGCHENRITHSLDSEFERYLSPHRKSGLHHKTYRMAVRLRFDRIENMAHVMEHEISIVCNNNRSHGRNLYIKFIIANELTPIGLLVQLAA